MTIAIIEIPLLRLVLAFLPVAVVVAILFRWSLNGRLTIIALSRMLIQLLLVGYVLTFIFKVEQASVVLSVLAVMLAAASWIALGYLQQDRSKLYFKALFSIALGGGLTLLLVTQAILRLDPWFASRYMIPLAGMIFANAMNCISLASERFESETGSGKSYIDARAVAFRAALIPLTNSMLAVGIVSIPGMMTGQILAGQDALVAARYQIMVMCMVFGSAGISTAVFLSLVRSWAEQTAR